MELYENIAIKTASFFILFVLLKKTKTASLRTRPFDNNSENKQKREFHVRY
jgi:hypothetical protein